MDTYKALNAVSTEKTLSISDCLALAVFLLAQTLQVFSLSIPAPVQFTPRAFLERIRG